MTNLNNTEHMRQLIQLVESHTQDKKDYTHVAPFKSKQDPNLAVSEKAINAATQKESVKEGLETQYIAARYIDEFADGDHWYVKGKPDVIQKFVILANSLEDEAVKGTEYEPGKGMMAKMHAAMGNDAPPPQWTIVQAQNLESIRPIGKAVLQRLMTPDLSDGAQEFMSDLLWELVEKGLALVISDGEQGVVESRGVPLDQCPQRGGSIASKSKLTENKDASYTKDKLRYTVEPSAYASGALVQCRKKGAKNWGNKGKKQ
jgi:hypothetical protein